MTKKYGININTLFYKLLLLFPITTLLQGFFDWINIVLFAIITVCLCGLIIKRPLPLKYFIIITIVILNHLYALANTSFSQINNMNTLYYYMFWILFSAYICIDYDNMVCFLKQNKQYVCGTLMVSLAIMFVSVLTPGAYYKGFFTSFSGSSARVCSVAMFMMTMILLVMRMYGKKSYIKYAAIPTYCIVMGESRTYLALGLVMLLILFWYFFDNKKLFFLLIIPICLLLTAIVYSSNIMDKIMITLNFEGNSYHTSDAVFTSGRSAFWKDMLNAYWKTDILRKLFGNGFHFVYTVRRFWAHNDFIQLLLTFGIVGPITYLWSVISTVRRFTKNNNLSHFFMVMVYGLWLFNAFFNMFYVYMCACISFPFLLISTGRGQICVNKDGMNEI